MRTNSSEALDRAEALFKKKDERSREGQDVSGYEADRHAAREKTARLRSLRLARDAAADNRKPVLPANKRPVSGE